jgi:hypothetical protein
MKIDVQKGDIIEAYGHQKVASLAGTVIFVGRVNVKIKNSVRFSPTGPWFDQEHTVPKHEIKVIVRNEEIIWRK